MKIESATAPKQTKQKGTWRQTDTMDQPLKDEQPRTNRKTAEQELVAAAEIQASFLPTTLPTLAGWDLAVALRPAQRTCGDFYDVIPMSNGRLGLVIADVAEKGAGAALYMALSRTLIRTFAILFPTRPDLALAAANRRILEDTASDLFVTLFLGVLDPHQGRLSYANAGHNPPLLFHASGQLESLTATGIPVGMFTGQPWQSAEAQMAAGDLLVLYTDGITEAQQGTAGQMFGRSRLATAVRANREGPALEMRMAVMTAVSHFVGDAPQSDDMALMIVKRLPH